MRVQAKAYLLGYLDPGLRAQYREQKRIPGGGGED
jgi:hypothetical protein